jgi:predicted nucleic acid-binding Zn ribbon protein
MSAMKKYRSTEIFPHKHCPRCKEMISEDQEYCSDECKIMVEAKDKKGKKTIFIFIGIYAVVLVVMLIFMFFLKPA